VSFHSEELIPEPSNTRPGQSGKRRPLWVWLLAGSVSLNILLVGVGITVWSTIAPLLLIPPPGMPGFAKAAENRITGMLNRVVKDESRLTRATEAAAVGLRAIDREFRDFRQIRQPQMDALVLNPEGPWPPLGPNPQMRMDELITSTVRSVSQHLTPAERLELLEMTKRMRGEE
jgi:hypothetical protein